jgi:hypothetical protein
MWFSACVVVFFSLLAALSFAGLLGSDRDTLDSLLMALGGAVVFAASWAALRFFA